MDASSDLPHAARGALPLLARFNWYWPFQLAGWGFLLLVSLSSGAGGDAGMLKVAVWGAVCGLLLSDLGHRALKRRIARGKRIGWLTVLVSTLALGMLQIVVHLFGYMLFKPFGQDVHGLAWLPAALLTWCGIYLVWHIFYVAVLSLRRANRLEYAALELAIAAKDGELRALQAQVNPHFFFNSMNSVRALIYEDPPAAARMVEQLASVMRYALQSGQDETVPLALELDAVQAYLAIEQLRFEQRLRVTLDVAPGLEHVRIPPMAVQTLVENAVKHGVENRLAGSDIRIHAARSSDGAAVSIEIANEGAIQPASPSTRMGLANTRKRLALALGARATLALTEDGGWVRATMTVPASH